MKQKLALILSLALTLTLTACGGSNQSQTPAGSDPIKSAPTQSVVSSCKAEAPETSQEADGQDVTDAYRDVLSGTYVDEYGDKYTIRQDGTLTCEATNGETEEGSWWVWEEGSKEYLSIYIKNTARLNNDPVKALHGQRDQFGAHPALVGIAVAPAADAFHIAMVAQNILQQHNIHIDCAKVIFQNADIPALLNHIAGIVPHKSRFARAKKAGDQIDLYHSCSPPVGGKLLVPVIISHFYSVCFIKPKFKKKNRHTGPCSCAAVFP